MSEVKAMWGLVFGLATILTLAVLMLPVAARTKIPYTVLLAIIGTALGFAAQEWGLPTAADGGYGGDHHGEGHASPADEHGGGSFWAQLFASIAGLRITSDVILFLFLPALVFESALSLDLRKLLADIRPILFLAIVGVLISSAIVGFTIAEISGMAIIVCLLLGAIVSATDPVAVIALFKDLNAPKRLTVLVEGESLFNDATAIVISSILLSMLTMNAGLDLASSLGQFLVVFLGGILVGILVARPAVWLMGAFQRETLIILTLTVTLPFIAFVVAEHFLHVSGVMAVVASGLTVGSIGRRLVPPQIFVEVEHAWHQLAFWATSLIFLLVGLATPRMLGGEPLAFIDEIIALIIVATLARMLIIYVMLPVLSRIGAAQKVSGAYQTIMVWGGLRGAVSLALALIVIEAPAVSEEARNFIGVLVTAFVLFTLLVQATTIHGVMGLFGLDKLSPADEALRDRSLSRALHGIEDELTRFATFHEVDERELQGIVARYDAAIAEAESRADGADAIGVEEWERVGLAIALAQERQLYLQRFGEGFTTTGQLRDALARLDDVSETLKAGGKRWSAAVARGVAFRRAFRYALALQRTVGLTGPLAASLSRRLSVLTFMRRVLREQRENGVTDIERLLPEAARDGFRKLFEERYEAVSQNTDALALQYPEYAASLHKRDLTLAGLRLEVAAYDRLLDQTVIGPDIHGDLIKRARGALSKVRRLPPLRLRLDTRELIARSPYFSNLSSRRQRSLARLLKTRVAVPGDHIIERGSIGEEMFFIASGAVDVMLPDGGRVALGSGDFFGELALITDAPRNADVIALGYSTLLVLRKRDFSAFLRKHADLREHIRRVAIERLGDGADVDI
ncbi:MAG: cation:proton antiporter [Pseudomonadota bacterium]